MSRKVIDCFFNIFKDKPRRVAEIGVGYEQKYVYVDQFIDMGFPTLLVEANPQFASILREIYAHKKNVEIKQVAVADSIGETTLYDAGYSSYIEGMSSPHLQKGNNAPAKSHKVNCVTFDMIDPGDIDIMVIDIEGAEWLVFKYMRSRPKIIEFEVGKSEETKYEIKYTNTNLDQIKQWMSDNGYDLFSAEHDDLIYIRRD